MATKVHMEALSPTMEEGQVVKWLKSEGDEVTNGEVLAEIETDKATMELSARGAGVLRKILVQEGGTAPVGEVIAVIAGADEDIGEVAGGPEAKAEESREAADQEAAESGAEAEEEAEEKADEEGEEGEDEPRRAKRERKAKVEAAEEPAETKGADRAEEGPGDGRVKASPLARRLAEERGLRLSSIEGSGPGGRIVKRDVEEAADRDAEAPARPAAARAPEVPEDEYQEIPLTQMRKTIARRLAESLGPIPHFFLTMDVDMARALEARKSINAILEADGEKISINDLVIRATAAALRRHPECNATWHGDHVRRYGPVHIGVAVAIEEGLITPVVRNAHRKGVAEIGREVKELAGRAREKKLKPEEYTGSTFSISNLGMFGIHEFTAVINPPEAGILAVGAVEETPVVVDGEVTVRPRMKITMSCDHRVIDGAQGSRFLATLRSMLEEPAAIVL